MERKNNVWMIIGFFVIIIVASVLIVVNKDTLFMNVVVVKYPDGCVEKFVDNELQTPICEYGRSLEDNETAYERFYSQKFNLSRISVNLSGWNETKGKDDSASALVKVG